jgi:hypothetical protein
MRKEMFCVGRETAARADSGFVLGVFAFEGRVCFDMDVVFFLLLLLQGIQAHVVEPFLRRI